MEGRLVVASQLQPIKAKYSIFLPVKNGEKYIATAIESILAQQLSDFVLIILENKSTDKTLSIVRGYDDSRIVVIEAPRGLDIYDSWRRVYDLIQSGLVSSEFSTIIGYDDIFYPMFLKNIEELISAYPGASLYQTHFDLIDEGGNIKRPCKAIPAREYAKDFFLARCWGIRDSFGTGYVFRTSDYIKVGGIPDLPLLLWSDDLLVIHLTKLSYKVCGGQSSFAYRLHNKSASGAVTTKKFMALAEALKCYVEEIESHNKELLIFNNDKIAFGYLIAKQIDLLSFPFRTRLLGKETTKTIEQVDEKVDQLLQSNTMDTLSEANISDRVWYRLRKYYIFLKLLSQKSVY